MISNQKRKSFGNNLGIISDSGEGRGALPYKSIQDIRKCRFFQGIEMQMFFPRQVTKILKNEHFPVMLDSSAHIGVLNQLIS